MPNPLSRESLRAQWTSALARLSPAVRESGLADDAAEVRFDEIDDRAGYERYQREHAALLERRRAVERSLAALPEVFGVPGYDALIDLPVAFEVDYRYSAPAGDGPRLPNWRERLVSPVTGLNNRLRGTFLAIRKLLAPRDLAGVRVYATEQLTPFFAWLRKLNPAAVGSEYLGDAVPRGRERRGVRNEDVTRLTFPDGAFDLVVTNDVLEHVPGYAAAYHELFRVLAPGGLLVLTVPFDLHRDEHLIRARVTPSGEIEHLLPPEYHGDPVNPEGGVLCYQIFGWRMLDELRAAGFARTGALHYWSVVHGLLGPDQCVFFAVKGTRE